MNFEQARQNMVKQQIRAMGVLDENILALMSTVPREDFVSRAYRKLAFSDACIPVACATHGQKMMAPWVEAKMLEALQIKSSDKVLEIGTGNAYVTALLAKQADTVFSVDMEPKCIEAAHKKLQQVQIDNVTLEEGDAAKGWSKHAPYDVIAITGALPTLPDAFRHDLAIGGRLFVVLGKSPTMHAMLITRVGKKEWQERTLFETQLDLLVNVKQPDVFEF